jgi:hypothetical protein
MKTLFLILALFLVGCSTTRTPTHILQKEVVIAEQEWAGFIAAEVPNSSDVFAVEIEKKIYLDAIKSGNEVRIHLAVRNYIKLIYNLMIPPLPEGSIYEGF